MNFHIANRKDIDKVVQLVIQYLINLDWAKQYAIKIAEYKNSRSINQNSLYWMWIHASSKSKLMKKALALNYGGI